MDAERVGGFTDYGRYCSWCGKQYPDAYFRQTIDVCWPCDDFRMRHYHDHGHYFMRTVDGVLFRVYVPDEPKMSDKEVDDVLRSLIRGPVI